MDWIFNENVKKILKIFKFFKIPLSSVKYILNNISEMSCILITGGFGYMALTLQQYFRIIIKDLS